MNNNDLINIFLSEKWIFIERFKDQINLKIKILKYECKKKYLFMIRWKNILNLLLNIQIMIY